MLVEKIVASQASATGRVADALHSMGIETTAETLAHAMRHSLHQISSGPFAALVGSMEPQALVSGLKDIGVEPIFIDIARKRMTAAGAEPNTLLDAEIERSVHAYIGDIVGTPV